MTNVKFFDLTTRAPTGTGEGVRGLPIRRLGSLGFQTVERCGRKHSAGFATEETTSAVGAAQLGRAPTCRDQFLTAPSALQSEGRSSCQTSDRSQRLPGALPGLISTHAPRTYSNGTGERAFAVQEREKTKTLSLILSHIIIFSQIRPLPRTRLRTD